MDVIYAWMKDLGIRLDDHEPDARQLAHMAMLRDARREADRGTTRVTRIARRLRLRPAGAGSTVEHATCACPA